MTPPDPRRQLLLAAERLIAERGPDVALRDVATAAGNRNNSAVHYHFGSRDGLIEAIIEYRQTPLENIRMALLAEHETASAKDDLTALVSILVRPLFDVPYADGPSHYARFLQRIRDHPDVPQTQLSAERWPATKILTTRLHRALTHLPVPARTPRLFAMASVMFTLLADYERRITQQPLTPAIHTHAEDDTVSMLVGLLSAPTPPTPATSVAGSRNLSKQGA
ncbi:MULTISPECIES: TetR/AcrR family transcriptional regulator [unclassified Mycobacteroides]|uniref:TetR/AcrR family transcriptional regulator n=1 Tax=unclassified Mycobacteroides TaxID=2618759 RepID=UPI0012DD6003|nr:MULTISPECIES: TetR/AcrR family transcriptional regulator [unclassified Mycobacteroides]